jgi:hypothetical protein
MEIWLHSFLTLTRDGSEWPADTRPLYPRVKNLCYPINRMLGGSQNWSGSFGEGINPLPMPELEPWTVQPVSKSLHDRLSKTDLMVWTEFNFQALNLVETLLNTAVDLQIY